VGRYILNLSTHKKSEVELRVAQELKNNKDFIYQTNQALQNLSNDIRDLTLNQKKLEAKLGSEHKDLLITFENLREWILSHHNNVTHRIALVESKIEANLNEFSELKQHADLNFVTHEQYVQDLLDNSYRVDDVEDELKLLEGYFNSTVTHIKHKITQSIEDVTVTLTPVKPDVDPLQIKFDQAFANLKIDMQGFVKELALVKQDIKYDNKKFEYIITRLERLKQGIE